MELRADIINRGSYSSLFKYVFVCTVCSVSYTHLKEQAALQCNATVTEGNTTEIPGSTEIENSEKEEKKPKEELSLIHI